MFHHVSRLCVRRSFFQKRLIRIHTTNGGEIKQNNEKTTENKDLNILLEKYRDKITFNSYLEHEKLKLGYFKYYLKTVKQAKKSEQTRMEEKSLPPLPISLRYFSDEKYLLKNETENEVNVPENKFRLPFEKATQVSIRDDDQSFPEKRKPSLSTDSSSEFNRANIDSWMTDYEYYDDTKLKLGKELEEDETLEHEWSKDYGTPDPTIGISQVPCGGCGSLLHCSDPSIPGYLPSEIFKGRNEEELKTLECQRCHFLTEFNIALDVSVQPEEYEKLLQSIRKVKCLVLLMVDLLDFPCSIWPGIVDIIGTDRPLIIVGNKVDLLPGDSIGYLKRIKESLMTEIKKTQIGEANIKHVCLISAKTGYGVEDLISAMFKVWQGKGDVFLVGCTNVGKSSLFNALLQSDYCKVHAVDIIKRATVSRWPGTTLNLLKFPINRPSGWKIYQRTRRLKSEAKLLKVEKDIRYAQLQGKKHVEVPALIGHIGKTFSDPREFNDAFSENIAEKRRRMMVLDEKHELFVNSHWFYDTPGVIHPDQVLCLLTTEELLVSIPKQLIRPQTYYLHKGFTIFIGGLARVDFVDCAHPCRFTIFCSEALPITVTKTEDADEVYDKFIGTELFAAPSGGTERLKNWPGLSKRQDLLEFCGEGSKWCCGDIVLSSVAWVSVTAKGHSLCKVAAWTPKARGIHKRYPSLLPYSINLKGKRIRDTPAYMIGNVFSDEE